MQDNRLIKSVQFELWKEQTGEENPREWLNDVQEQCWPKKSYVTICRFHGLMLVQSINQVYFTQVSMAETEYTYKKKKKTDNKKNRSQVYSHKTFHSSIT